jgi:hypothetical protein
LFFLTWTLSGIVMTLPFGLYPPMQARAAQPVNYRQAGISPSEAIARVEQRQGGTIQVTGVWLTQIQDALVYSISASDGRGATIDARTGEPFALTAAMAENIVRQNYAIQAELQENRRIEKYQADYPAGLLPVYRVVFRSDQDTAYYVSPDGTTQRSDRLSRIRNAIAAMHTLEPLTWLTHRARITQGLLVAAGLVGMSTALTGYYLALPRRRARS